jgi:hypothetical protein
MGANFGGGIRKAGNGENGKGGDLKGRKAEKVVNSEARKPGEIRDSGYLVAWLRNFSLRVFRG